MTADELLGERPADACTEERILDDPARGRRRVVLGDDGLPVRIELADGTSLRIDRDDRSRALSVVDDTGALVIGLHAIGDADRGAAADRPIAGSRAANLDGTHRLSARDASGVVTTADVSDHGTRLEREGDVLRIDVDPDGRPLRVSVPGLPTDIEYRGNGAGCWEVGPLSTEPMVRLTVDPDQVTYDLGTKSGWTERAEHGAVVIEELNGAPVAEVGLDHAGRIVGKRWQGGAHHTYERDEDGRLARWSSVGAEGKTTRTERRYRDGELSETTTDGARTVVRTDAGGRITRLLALQGSVSFGYDANGRRVSRSDRGGETRYRYDALGQLTEVRESDGRTVRYGWDGLGRRVWVESEGRRWREHRDPSGRLWSVTDERGQLVHAFLWWDGRVLARTDGIGVIDEVYLTDPVGTLMGVGTRAEGGWRFEEAVQPPFGRVESAWRPTLFGHIADACTGLICFGARDLDPETGVFLTPDPWHGELDDPRRVAGDSPEAVVLAREAPIAGIHPYALGQGDPLSRPDIDGHFAWGHAFWMLLLSSTWGFPLTSLSVFLFLPLNIYIEVISLVIGLFRWGHPWPQHSLFTMRLLSGSSHLGTFALALNGFLPRAAAGVTGDRCITIGYVVWENRRYFNMLDRARVLEIDDVRGTPLADGKPSADARKLSDAPQGSVLAVLGTDGDNRIWIHGTWWTRGPGNAVGTRGGGVAGVQSFEDRVAAGTAHARGSVFLAQPLPEDMSRERLQAVEYSAGAGSKTSTGLLVQNVWFAFQVPKNSGLAANAVIEIRSDGSAIPAYGKILRIVAAEEPIAVLDHELPALVPPRRTGSIKLRKLTASATTSANWAVGAGTANRSLTLPAPGHVLAVDDVFEYKPTAPGGAIPATPERPAVYSRLTKVSTTVQLAPPVAALALGGASIFRVSTDGTALNGNVPDPVARPTELTIGGAHKLVVGDLVAVQPTAPAGAPAHYGKVTAVAAAVPAVPPAGGAPGKPAVPAKLTIDPPFTLPAATAVRVTRLKESNRTLDTGAHAVQAGDNLTVDVRASDVFAVGNAVRIEAAGGPYVRRVAAITAVAIESEDDLTGTAPYTLTKYDVGAAKIDSKLSSARFVKHTGGDLPSTYGVWPAELMGLVADGYPREREPMGWRFFINASPPPAGLHPRYRDFWEPLTLGADQYWLLRSDLKIVDDGGTHYWEPDPDDTYPRRHRQQVLTPTTVKVRGFTASGVKRPEAGGGRVLASAAETQVPNYPRVRWSLADALADHELSHTVQNTYWGPLLGALPLGGLLHTLRDVVEASGDDPPDWMEPVAGDMNFLELVSLGGIMQLAWTYVILSPALGNEKAREYLTTRDFDDWSTFLNPVNRQIINAIPPVDRNVPETQGWEHVLGNFIEHMLDLRSWTPLMGFVKLLLPDSPKNFLEQQASRWSGDVYSTILTADDKSNLETSFIGNDFKDADLTKPVGTVVRMMSYYSDALARNLLLDLCDAPGSHLTQLTDNFDRGANRPLVSFEHVGAAGMALVHAELYEHVPGSTAPTPVQLDGPIPAGGGAAPTAAFLLAPVGCVLRPNLRSVVPIPPAVMRAVGFHLVGAGPAKWKVAAYDDYAGSADDPKTAVAELTFDSTVKLGDEDVPWSVPFASGTAATAPPATLLERFVTEKQPLTVSGSNTSTWTAQADAGAGITLTPRAGGHGWDAEVTAPPGGVALPHDTRVRVWSRIVKDDPAVFRLHHDDVPSLKGHRSYLDEDLFIPVRDVIVRVKDLPVLPPLAFNAADHADLDLVVNLAGRASIVPTGALVTFERKEARPPRGERWRFQLAGRKAVEAAQVVPVTVRFGSGARTVDRRFDLTVNPNFTIDKAAGVAKYEVVPGTPLVLTVNGGAGGFSVVAQPPAAARTTIAVAGTAITLTVAPPPAPPGPAKPPVNYDLVVKDSSGHLGIRKITIRP